MNRQKAFALFSSVLAPVTMYPVFRVLSAVFQDNWRIGWILGLMIYWLLWGMVYPISVAGRESIRAMIKPQKPDITLILLVLFPLIMAVVFKYIPGGMHYDKPDKWILMLLIFSAFGNGFFEEIFWRGVYMQLFPRNIFYRIVWPSIWFGLWHYVPGSLNPSEGHVMGLMIGALFLGFYSGFLAWKTNSLWWSILTHVVGGLIIVF